MIENIWPLPREAFCLLNQNETLIISSNHNVSVGLCLIYDHVSKLLKTSVIGYNLLANSRDPDRSYQWISRIFYC